MKTLILAVSAFAIIQVLEGYTILPRTFSASYDKRLEVGTTNGPVRGFLAKTCRNQTIFVGFRGIPYAEPPVGKLRFKNPVEKSKWNGVYDATFQRPGCMQGSFDNVGVTTQSDDVFSEDCLYLNVYTPNLKYLENPKAPLKAVMVFIHGGAFIMGSSYESNSAPDFLVEQDVVLVTMNYRLGVFGFLSLQNADVPGNAGLKDQNLALKWVKKNIKAFGGDPDKITIFGESAGSASVNYHLLSKSSADLFGAAIMESGTVLSSWAYTSPESALQRAKKLGSTVKCKKMNKPEQFLDCLQKVDANVLAQSQSQVLTIQDLTCMDVIPFEPTKEPNVPGAFMTENPSDVLFSGNFTKVPVVIGSNSDEGLLVYTVFRNNSLSNLLLTLLSMDLSRLAPAQFNLKPMSITAIKVHQAIGKFYFKNKLVNEAQIGKVLELIGDVNFVFPTQVTAKLIAENSPNPVYNYQFNYDGGYGIYKASVNMMDVPGVSHADELGYLFYTPGFHMNCAADNSNPSPSDELTVDRMTKMWTDFAKTRNPTPKIGGVISSKWQQLTAKVNNYMSIGKDLTPSTDLKMEMMKFWDDTLQIILGQKNPKTRDLDEANLFALSW